MTTREYGQLVDYRRRVARLYAHVRNTTVGPEATWRRFHEERDDLFATHTMSPLDSGQKHRFTGLRYYPYNGALRFRVRPHETAREEVLRALPEDGEVRMERFASLAAEVDGVTVSLSVYWILGYGGGIFLPFRDATSGHGTYGGGRYLLDTIKHADLGSTEESITVDFNYAYNPSCAYNPRWHCPLAPRENHLPVPIEAGEMAFNGA